MKSLQVLSRGDQQLSGMLGADPAALQQVRGTALDEFGQLKVEVRYFLVEELHAPAELSQCELGCLQRFAQTFHVGS